MKRAATLPETAQSLSHSVANSSSRSRRYKYTKVLDNRKHPIRGLWKRNDKFFARITVADELGRKALKWVPLEEAKTAAAAQEAFRKLLVERGEDQLRHIGRCPKFADYVEDTYKKRLKTSGKKPDTITTEEVHLNQLSKTIGHLTLDKIKPHHVSRHLHDLKEAGRANRTCNLALVMVRNVFKSAKIDGYVKTAPVDGIPWQRSEKKARRLFTRQEINLFCQAAMVASKNGEEFSDYVRLMALCGAREQETIKLRWADVDFEHRLLTIGADADTKNREARRVDLNGELEARLQAMKTRRPPDTKWLFPSPQREADEHAKTFRESLLLTRAVLGWTCQDCQTMTFGKDKEMPPKSCLKCRGTHLTANEAKLWEHFQQFGFHDCRHHFISYAVMSGIDYMTIARWVGHKDGGILIGKVYGHLSNEHAQAQAARLNFGPTVITLPAVSKAGSGTV